MSKVPYTVDVDRYICSELESIRTMIKTLDFSSLLSTVERIQYHASAMEDALYAKADLCSGIYRKAKDEEVSDKEVRDFVISSLKKKR